MDSQDSGADPKGAQLATLYERRFSPKELASKRVLWDAICRGFLDKVRPGLIRAYLRLPLLWTIFGRQMFVAAHAR